MYHTDLQVLVGVGAGISFAIVWFVIVAIARNSGWVHEVMDHGLGKALRLRDLVVTEDLTDAGWARWEQKRKRDIQATKKGR